MYDWSEICFCLLFGTCMTGQESVACFCFMTGQESVSVFLFVLWYSHRGRDRYEWGNKPPTTDEDVKEELAKPWKSPGTGHTKPKKPKEKALTMNEFRGLKGVIVSSHPDGHKLGDIRLKDIIKMNSTGKSLNESTENYEMANMFVKCIEICYKKRCNITKIINMSII